MLDYENLRSDQQACIDELYGSDGCFMVMRMGGGKTATVLTAIAELIADGHRRRAIVMAPPLVAATVWPQEPAKWAHLEHLSVEVLSGGPAKRKKRLLESDADILLVSDGVAGWLSKELEALPDGHPLLDILAYDEPKTKDPRGHIGKKLCDIAPRVKSVWLFSGTPRPNGYEDLYMPARILKPGLWSADFDEWRRRNFMPLDYNNYNWQVHDFRAKELDVGVRTFMVQAPEPEGSRSGTLSSGEDFDTEIDLPADAMKQYKRMERDLLIEIEAGVKRDIEKIRERDGFVDEEAVMIAALSQAVASSKLAQIAQGFVYDKPEDGSPQQAHAIHDAKMSTLATLLDAAGGENTVICYGFRHDLSQIEKLLKKQRRSYGVLGDGRSMKAKLRDVERWNEGKLDNLVMHPASAGHGVELQFGGRRMFWYCPTWSNEQYDQTLKRLDRPGQEQQVYSHQIIAKETVDIVKRNRVQYRMADQDAFKSMLRSL